MSDDSFPQNQSFKNVILPNNISIPSTLISYILKRDNKILLNKPENFVYKICSICKYFFSRLRIISCFRICAESEYLEIGYIDNLNKFSKTTVSLKLLKKIKMFFCPNQIDTDMAYLRDPDITEKAPSNSISILLPKIFNYRIKFLGFQNQELTFQEYKYLTLNDKCQVVFTDCKITENKFIVPAEKLLQASPNLCQFSLYFDNNKELSYCTSLTSKKLAEFPPFKYLKHFVLYNLSGNFNALHFVEFIKKNYQNGNGSCAKFGVSFKENVSHQFIQNFKSVVNSSVISMKGVKREHIFFNGQTLTVTFFFTEII